MYVQKQHLDLYFSDENGLEIVAHDCADINTGHLRNWMVYALRM